MLTPTVALYNDYSVELRADVTTDQLQNTSGGFIMIKDQSEYYTIFRSDIESYLAIAYFPDAEAADHTIHENCANHEEAFDRAKKQHAAMPDSRAGNTKYFIAGMCRDASCRCAGLEGRTDCWVRGELYQYHYTPLAQPMT
jgi:hypothetical protein